MKLHSSSLSILLALVAALLLATPVTAQRRKLRKDGADDRRGRRLTEKSSKDGKCHKSSNANCVGFKFTFSRIPVQQKDDLITGEYSVLSYGNGRDWDGTCDGGDGDECQGWISASPGDDPPVGTVDTKAIAVGSVVYQHGKIGKESTDEAVTEVDFDDPDYYFYQQCEVLGGRIKDKGKDKGKFKAAVLLDPDDNGSVRDRSVPLKCDIFLQNGKGYTGFEDLPDTVHLRGYTKGTINARANVDSGNENGLSGMETYKVEELYKVNDFFATVIGGTGRWAGSIGQARVFTEGSRGESLDEEIPPAGPSGWQLDLFATVSPSYDELFNVVELPPPLDMAPDTINWPFPLD